MNYVALSDAIQAYTENTDATFVAEIPVFVRQAEQRIYNTIQFPSLRKNVTGSTTNNNKYLACPSDFLSVYSLALVDALGNYEYLLNKDVNFIRQAYPNPNDKALPKYYALFGSQSNDPNELTFILGPTPDATYVAELHYFYYPESIVDAGTSWLGDNFDSVLLYGSLVEAYTYMKGEQDMMALYNGKYQEALAMAKRLGDGLERQDAYRSGQVRIQVT
jgi:CTP:phosphocholine cytidylyltransferase-like protein